MAKRQPLNVSLKARKAVEQAAELEKRRTEKAEARPGEAMTTTAVHIPKDVLALLRRVAVERANREGGRPSVSAVLVSLVERHRGELEKEARPR